MLPRLFYISSAPQLIPKAMLCHNIGLLPPLIFLLSLSTNFVCGKTGEPLRGFIFLLFPQTLFAAKQGNPYGGLCYTAYTLYTATPLHPIIPFTPFIPFTPLHPLHRYTVSFTPLIFFGTVFSTHQ